MKRNKSQTSISANFKQAKVLLIEDNHDYLSLIQGVMHECLAEVNLVSMASAQEALAQLDTWRHQEWELPKLILLDLYLPDREVGWQVLEQIKRMDPVLQLIPIVILSGSADREDILKSYQLGASTYLVKPQAYAEWVTFFGEIRRYYWETVSFPPLHFE